MAGWNRGKGAIPVVSIPGRGRHAGGQRRRRRRPGKADASRSSDPHVPQDFPARGASTLTAEVEDRAGSLVGRTFMTLVRVGGLLAHLALPGCPRAAPVN